MCTGNCQCGPQQLITNEAINVKFAISVDIDVLSASTVNYAAAWYENSTILSTPEVALNKGCPGIP